MLVRTVVGAQLRRRRQAQDRTLREVSRAARVSLGYLSELERGRKEASSELLGSICDALAVPLSTLLRDASDDLALAELVDSAQVQPAQVQIAQVQPAKVQSPRARLVAAPALTGAGADRDQSADGAAQGTTVVAVPAAPPTGVPVDCAA